jgi:Holliday junction resolvase RusA-like endonuclease
MIEDCQADRNIKVTGYDYKVVVLGEPMAQQRHDARKLPCKGAGKRAGGELWYRMKDIWLNMYDPSKDDKRDFLRLVKAAAPKHPLLGPLRVDLFLFFPHLKSHYRTGKYKGQLKENAPLWKDTGKDRDNCDKLVLDALTDTFWVNDSQVCDGRIIKQYRKQPRTEVYVTLLVGDEKKNKGPGTLFEVSEK